VNKFLIATIAMGFFLISTQAAAVENATLPKGKAKPAITKAVASHSAVNKRKPVKLKKKVTHISFEEAPVATVAKHQPKLKKDVKKNYKAVFCQDGYVVKNQAFCAINAKSKAAPNNLAKKGKASRMIASQKLVEPKKAAKVIKK
jgi:hypothetical protein